MGPAMNHHRNVVCVAFYIPLSTFWLEQLQNHAQLSDIDVVRWAQLPIDLDSTTPATAHTVNNAGDIYDDDSECGGEYRE